MAKMSMIDGTVLMIFLETRLHACMHLSRSNKNWRGTYQKESTMIRFQNGILKTNGEKKNFINVIKTKKWISGDKEIRNSPGSGLEQSKC